jgi:hypothetical protein
MRHHMDDDFGCIVKAGIGTPALIASLRCWRKARAARASLARTKRGEFDDRVDNLWAAG